MTNNSCPADLTTLPLREWCIWSDRSLGWDDPDITQELDDMDKEAGKRSLLRWEYAPAAMRERRRGAFSLRRVRLPLSALHPSLRDIEFWTLDGRSTLVLFIALLVLVSFGAAIFA